LFFCPRTPDQSKRSQALGVGIVTGWRNPQVNVTAWAGVWVGLENPYPDKTLTPQCGSGVCLEGKMIQTENLIGIL